MRRIKDMRCSLILTYVNVSISLEGERFDIRVQYNCILSFRLVYVGGTRCDDSARFKFDSCVIL